MKPLRDEHEVDTAQRPWPREIAESVRTQLAAAGARRSVVDPNETAKMAPLQFDDVLRHESGTQRVLSREQIARHVAAQRPQAIDIPIRTGAQRDNRLAPLFVAIVVLAIAFGFIAGRLSAL